MPYTVRSYESREPWVLGARADRSGGAPKPCCVGPASPRIAKAELASPPTLGYSSARTSKIRGAAVSWLKRTS